MVNVPKCYDNICTCLVLQLSTMKCVCWDDTVRFYQGEGSGWGSSGYGPRSGSDHEDRVRAFFRVVYPDPA